MIKQDIILIGGGGHCKSAIEVIESVGQYKIVGILDRKEKIGQSVSGYHIVATEEDIAQYIEAGNHFLITVGQIKSHVTREKIYRLLKKTGATLATVISKHAIVSSRSVIGEGSIIMHGVIINAGVEIGVNCIINTNANIEHDCKIGDQVHISTGAILNGDCTIGNAAFIGSNTTIVNQTVVAANVLIGAGSLVRQSIDASGVYAGNPCRKIKDQI